jgi:hypothetical protein
MGMAATGDMKLVLISVFRSQTDFAAQRLGQPRHRKTNDFLGKTG